MAISITINKKKLEAENGATVLELAADAGIHIPTLCCHRALGPFGVCRLCIVEVEGPALSRTITPACMLRGSDGMKVETATPSLLKMRKTILELLVSGTAQTERLRALVRGSGITRRKFKAGTRDGCALCGLCVRACREIIGAGALSFGANEKNGKKLAEYVVVSKEKCIGCGTCAAICPVDAIKVRDRGRERHIVLYGKTAVRIALLACECCGAFFTTRQFIDSILFRMPQELITIKNLCPECARRSYARALSGDVPLSLL